MTEPITLDHPAQNVLYDVAFLDSVDDARFVRIVRDNLGTLEGDRLVWRALCHPDIADRTAGCLDEIDEALSAQINDRGLPSTHHKAKLLNVVRHRAAQVDAALQKAGQREATPEQEQSRVREMLRLLTVAVDAHRRTCIAADLAPEPHDLALWSNLDELHLPGGLPRYLTGGPSLAEMVTSGTWGDANG